MLWILAEEAATGQGGMFSLLVPFAAIFLIMYLLFIRPQKKQEAARREMLANITKNDKIVTNGGLIGVVTNVKDDEVVIRVDDSRDVKVRIARSGVAGLLVKKEEQGG